MNKCNHQENKTCFGKTSILEIPHRADFLFRKVSFGSGVNKSKRMIIWAMVWQQNLFIIIFALSLKLMKRNINTLSLISSFNLPKRSLKQRK